MGKALILTCGGFKGFTMLGFLYKLFQILNADGFNVLSGSSIGACIVCMIAEGYSINKILLYSLKFVRINIKTMAKYKNLILDDLGEIFKNKTFEDYEKIGKYIIITTYDSKTNENIYFNSKTYPKKLIREAVFESMNIPSIDYILSENHFDGAICTPIPVFFTKQFIKKYNLNNEGCVILFTKWDYVGTNKEMEPISVFINLIIRLYNNMVDYELHNSDENDIVFGLKNLRLKPSEKFNSKFSENLESKFFEKLNKNDIMNDPLEFSEQIYNEKKNKWKEEDALELFIDTILNFSTHFKEYKLLPNEL